MYFTHSSKMNQTPLFSVVREKRAQPPPMREEEVQWGSGEPESPENLPAIIEPKRVKQRLPGVRLLRKLAAVREECQ